METIQSFLSYLIHIDVHLFSFVATYGALTYIALFIVIFCETGLIVMPILPGDSLLFAAGSITANTTGSLRFSLLLIILFIASVLGNKVNYLVGRFFGNKLTWLIKKKHLDETQDFYAKHGGKTIIYARFIPIIRTFAPFVAGISNMNFREFLHYNTISAALWVGSLLTAGYCFGGIPIVKAHFSLVIYGIMLLSIMPPIVAVIYSKIQTAIT